MTETGYGMYAQAILSLGFVIGLILVTAKLMKLHIDPASRKNGKKRRLSVSESLNIDGRNRLLLIKRDDVEHLVMIGGTSPLLVEKDIPQPANFQSVLEEETSKNDEQKIKKR